VRSPRWCEPEADGGPMDLPPRFAPPVSILKPLRGVDGHLEKNLESFCELDYPDFEIIFAIADAADPAVAVARTIQAKHHERSITVVAGEGANVEALNQKVANLLPALAHARHPFVLISDSNILVEPDYLREIAGHMADPGVGLVTNLIRGMGGRELGARMENLHLNSFVMASVAFLDRFLHLPLAVGKSMLIRREALDSIGGLAFFCDILAEDYVMGRNLAAAGWKVALCHHKVTNVNEGWSFGNFVSRHARWARLRRRLSLAGYLCEPLATPFSAACLGLLCAPAGAPFLWGVTLVVASAAGVTIGNLAMGYLTGSDLEASDYLLSPLKDLVAGVVWFVPFFSNRVVWRGNAYKVGKDTRVAPLKP
jgi:ceramide glucosyltransferase